ncbi:MAG TPA: hypothetical protein PKK26_11970 [Candidatus Wallbacteria bacterium]|nr:hypothetical protein [Candidatus Wallbacteria bacterium]
MGKIECRDKKAIISISHKKYGSGTWETLSANRDLPRKPPFPSPSMLRVVKELY